MTKRKPKKRIVPKVKRIKLTPKVVLVVEAPKGIIPAIVPHPEKNVVEIVPVKAPSKTWWQRTFG